MNLAPINNTDVPLADRRLPPLPLLKPQSAEPALAPATEEAAIPCFAPARRGWLPAILILGMAAGFPLSAQEPGSAPQTNNVVQIISEVLQTNDVTGAEDMLPVNDIGQPDDSPPGNEAASSNGSSEANRDGASASGQPDSRHSGRESRSRRFSRHRSSQSGSSGGASDSAFGSPNQTGTNSGPVSLDYSAFKVVADRNIFNPNRFRHQINDRPPTQEPEYFTLVGVMSYDKGTFAFFNGPSSAYQKALKAADSIAGYKLAAITPNSVELARETNKVELSVGMQMRLDDDGTWRPASASTFYAASSSAASSGSETNSQAGPASSGAESDIIKRMMQRREQE